MNGGVVARYDLPNAAPEPLRLVQRFVNTVDEEHGREWWPTPEALSEWFREQGLGAGGLDESDLGRARELRKALQALLRANNGRPLPDDARRTVNDAAARLRLRLDDSVRIVPDDRFGHVLAVAFEAMLDGSWARLKACRQCGWVFYDYSRNRSGSWCSMQICGNRLKTRAYRRRKRSSG
jgi:predicted RNA-binding Zn ribbon-like protein